MSKETRERIAFRMQPETRRRIEQWYAADNCQSKNEFIEKAVNFASFKRPKLPALRAEVAAAATPATPCLYPAFSFVLSNPSENGSHPASILWLGLGLASSRKGTHKAFCRPWALDFSRSCAAR